MVKRYSITQAKANLSRLIEEVEKGSQIELTRRGKPVVVMTKVEASDSEGPGFRELYQEFRRRFDLVELNIDPDEIWGDIRDRSR
jgi:prevent-host-death family protein